MDSREYALFDYQNARGAVSVGIEGFTIATLDLFAPGGSRPALFHLCYNIFIMKIAFFETSDSDKKMLSDLLPGIDAVYSQEKINKDTLEQAKDAQIISVFINSMIDQTIIDALPNLKCISTRSTGYDHINVEYAKTKGISVATVPGYGAHTVAEFTFALMLALSRKLFQAHHQLREEGNFDFSNLTGFDLAGKTLGVVGTGKIGKNVVRISKGFAMNVLATDAFPDAAFAQETGIKYVDLPTLLLNSDIVTLHTPYMKETHHLINKENIKMLKKGALLINTARGELIDTDALVWALQNGIIAGAGLDVLEGERYMKEEMSLMTNDNNAGDTMKTKEGFKMLLEDHELIQDHRVIATPHIAFSSQEAKAEILKITAENILAFTQGKAMNLVQK